MITAALFTRARTWEHPRRPVTDEWIKKSWYIRTTEYYSAIKRNKFESVELRWMNPEAVTQTEVRKKKQISYINACIWNLKQWCWWTYLRGGNRDADAVTRLVDTVWEGERGTNGENRTEAYTLLYVKYTARGTLLCNTGSSTQCDTWRGGMVPGGEGRRPKRKGMYVY